MQLHIWTHGDYNSIHRTQARLHHNIERGVGHKISPLTEAAIANCYLLHGSVFSKVCQCGNSTVFQWKHIYSRICGWYKLTLLEEKLDIKLRRKERADLRRVEEESKYDQNTWYKKLVKVFQCRVYTFCIFGNKLTKIIFFQFYYVIESVWVDMLLSPHLWIDVKIMQRPCSWKNHVSFVHQAPSHPYRKAS